MSQWALKQLFISKVSSEHSGLGLAGTSGGIFICGACAGKNTSPHNNALGEDRCSHLTDEETEAQRRWESSQRTRSWWWGKVAPRSSSDHMGSVGPLRDNPGRCPAWARRWPPGSHACGVLLTSVPMCFSFSAFVGSRLPGWPCAVTCGS